MKARRLTYFAVCSAFLFTQAAFADHVTTVYGNSAGSDGIRILSVNVDTGVATLTDHITQGGAASEIASGNGRGVVTVGTTIYYTYAGDGGGVYSYNLGSHTNNGLLFHVAGAGGLSTAAWDGTDLIFSDYSGSNKAFFYTPTGTLVNTINLNNAAGFYDGLEFANGGLIANRGDTVPPYDKYAIGGGAPTTSAFINAGAHNGSDTGIAYDGTYYFVSEIFANKLGVYDNSGAFVKEITLPAGGEFEDLSVDYQLVIGTVPEPSSVLLLTTVVGLIAFRIRKRA